MSQDADRKEETEVADMCAEEKEERLAEVEALARELLDMLRLMGDCHGFDSLVVTDGGWELVERATAALADAKEKPPAV